MEDVSAVIENQQNKLLDMYITSLLGEAYAFEFKCHTYPHARAKESKSHFQAGRALTDLFRLGHAYSFGITKCIFVYLLSPSAAAYFNNTNNQLLEVFGIVESSAAIIGQDLLTRLPNVAKHVKVIPITCTVEAIFSCSLPKEHEIRVYWVLDS